MTKSVTALAAAWFLSVGVYLSAIEARAALGQQGRQPGSAADGDVEVLQLRPNFFMIAGAGGNIGVQVGDAPIEICGAHARGVHDGPVGRRHARGLHHAHESRVSTEERPAEQRSGDDDIAVFPPRGHSDRAHSDR